MEESIANVGMLKSLADSLIDVVTFYMATWAPYHTAFRAAAAGILIPAGMVWTAINTLKIPEGKGVTAFGSLLLLSALVLLLSPTDKLGKLFPGAGTAPGIQYAEGAYWSFTIPKEVYGVFNSALKSVEKYNSGKDAALRIAYDMNTSKVASKWDNTPLQTLYTDYVSKCTVATMANANTEDNIRALGHVGLHSGSGIGYTSADRDAIVGALSKYKEVEENFYGENVGTFTSLLGYTPMGILYKKGSALSEAASTALKSNEIEGLESEGKNILSKIPEDSNPFNNIATTAPSGYRVPTADYWRKKWALPTQGGADYFDGSSVDEGKFKNPEIVSSGTDERVQNPGFYPENCVEAYEMADLAVAEYRKALADLPEFKGAPADYTAVATNAEMAEIQKYNRLRANAMTSNREEVRLNSAAIRSPTNAEQKANDIALELYAKTQSMGAKISEWFLQVKMPFFISTLSMMCAGLLTAFPLVIIISVFMGHKILVSFAKMIVFCFLVILINQTFLSIGATLIAITKQMDLVYAIGNIARDNQGLEMSAATAEVAIFSAIFGIELIIGKMLIWDDVKGLSGFNPGAAGNAAFATGSAALKIAGSLAAAPLALKARAASAAASASSNKLNKMLIQRIASNGANVSSAVRGMANRQERQSQGGPQGGGPGQKNQNNNPQGPTSGPRANLSSAPKDSSGPSLVPPKT
jgi:hypothetical protein